MLLVCPAAVLRWVIGRLVACPVVRRRDAESSSFAGFRVPPELILLAIRWYLRFGLSYRDVEELLAKRGVGVDHVTVYRVVAAVHPAGH
jgi:transposase-like protein